jgi:hypothetical protein
VNDDLKRPDRGDGAVSDVDRSIAFERNAVDACAVARTEVDVAKEPRAEDKRSVIARDLERRERQRVALAAPHGHGRPEKRMDRYAIVPYIPYARGESQPSHLRRPSRLSNRRANLLDVRQPSVKSWLGHR